MKWLSKIKDLYLANKETKVKNRVLAAIGGFGFAFGAFAGVGTMEGGHVWLGLAIIAMALACGCLAVLVARSEESEIEERRSRRDRF